MYEIAISSQNNVFERIFFGHKNAIVTKFVSIIIIIQTQLSLPKNSQSL